VNYQAICMDSPVGGNFPRPIWQMRKQPISSSLSGTTSESLSLEQRSHLERQVIGLLRQVKPLVRETHVVNWDGEQGEPITQEQWVSALVLAVQALRESLPAPFVSPCGDGAAHLQWTTPFGNRGVVEIGSKSIGWSFLPMTPSDGEDLAIELRSMDEALERVRRLHTLR
jgi:hypothetical protein